MDVYFFTFWNDSYLQRHGYWKQTGRVADVRGMGPYRSDSQEDSCLKDEVCSNIFFATQFFTCYACGIFLLWYTLTVCRDIQAAKTSRMHLIVEVSNNTVEAARARNLLRPMLFTFQASLMTLLLVKRWLNLCSYMVFLISLHVCANEVYSIHLFSFFFNLAHHGRAAPELALQFGDDNRRQVPRQQRRVRYPVFRSRFREALPRYIIYVVLFLWNTILFFLPRWCCFFPFV